MDESIIARGTDGRQLKSAGLTLNRDTREVRHEGRPIALETREFQLLEYLLRNKNRIVSRQEIYQEIWGRDILDHTLDAKISSLRKKIEPESCPKMLYTISRKGYLLVDE